MSDIGEQSNANSEEGSLGPFDVYILLWQKLEIAAKRLEHNAIEAKSIQDNQSWNNLGNIEVLPEQLADFKEKALEMMKRDFKSRGPVSDHYLEMSLQARVKQSLKEHIVKQKATITNMNNELESVRKLRNSLTTRADDMATTLKQKIEQQKQRKSKDESERKKRNDALDAKHRELIRAVRAVTAFAFPEGNRIFQEILGALLDKWFTHDPYVEEEDGWSDYVEFLLRTGMVSRHPDDTKLIRLVDFM